MDVPEDESVMRAVERRRAAEFARQKRIFNARNRVIGLDVQALKQQVAEKRRSEERELQRQMAWGKN